MKEIIKIPVYHYEDNKGRIIIDEKEMKKSFDNKMKYLRLQTKLGRREAIRNLIKNRNDNNTNNL